MWNFVHCNQYLLASLKPHINVVAGPELHVSVEYFGTLTRQGMRSRRESRQETQSWGRKKTAFPFWELRFCSEKWCIKIPTNRTFPTNQVKTEYIFWPVSCRQCSDHSAWGKVSKQDPFGGRILKFMAKIIIAPSEKKISNKPNQATGT